MGSACIGLNKTGGKALFTQQVAVDMMQRLCVSSTIFQNLPSDNVFKSGNISAVFVTAEMGRSHAKAAGWT